MKPKLYPWRAEKKSTTAEQWKMAQDVASRLKDSSPGSFATSIEDTTLVFGIINGDGKLHMFVGNLVSSTVDEEGNTPPTPAKVLFETAEAPEVNTTTPRTNRA